ncbi:unnamed protein product [Nesidiocoris tenuis]|uniref:Uncharacterized protein n=1 Tax=Nesidiocoris tenuis TaxID=355587 RepID=A0A6H5GAJ3_9HEMI|nr:unnamed protein product [Nesidiocoris tenuis]
MTIATIPAQGKMHCLRRWFNLLKVLTYPERDVDSRFGSMGGGLIGFDDEDPSLDEEEEGDEEDSVDDNDDGLEEGDVDDEQEDEEEGGDDEEEPSEDDSEVDLGAQIHLGNRNPETIRTKKTTTMNRSDHRKRLALNLMPVAKTRRILKQNRHQMAIWLVNRFRWTDRMRNSPVFETLKSKGGTRRPKFRADEQPNAISALSINRF